MPRCRSKPPVRFPRMRGDVPHIVIVPFRKVPFSPHARGCSGVGFGHGVGAVVFPACAGMFRLTAGWVAARKGFPRMRGDVPYFSSVA